MADREDAGFVRRDPRQTGGMRYALGRVLQCEYLAHRPPSATPHPDNDRRSQIANQRAKVLVGASIDPARPYGSIHRAFFGAENGVGQKHRRVAVELSRLGHIEPCLHEQFSQIVVGLVVWVVAAAVADEIADIAEILADSQQLGPFMAEPRLPMADHIGVEIEFGAAADLAGVAFDTNPTSLTRRHQRAVLIGARCAPD